MKKFNPNPLNRKRQNGSRNPFFQHSKEFTPNGLDWRDIDDEDEDEEEDTTIFVYLPSDID